MILSEFRRKYRFLIFMAAAIFFMLLIDRVLYPGWFPGPWLGSTSQEKTSVTGNVEMHSTDIPEKENQQKRSEDPR